MNWNVFLGYFDDLWQVDLDSSSLISDDYISANPPKLPLLFRDK